MIKWLKSLFARNANSGTLSSNLALTSSGEGTEFSAEVVRITRVLPHPGADRLEIARFEMSTTSETSYEVVVQKNTVSPGDLMAYFSVDCLLPTSHPEFAFLLKRLDGEGKTTYRLRAARLRGVFSQGLLVAAPTGASIGASMADTFGVTYHLDPEPSQAAQSPTGTPHRVKLQPMPVYAVDSLKKVPRLFDQGEPVMVTEKIHGANFRFGWVRRKLWGIPFGWRFVVGSHRVVKGSGGVGHYYGEDLWSQAAHTMALAERTQKHKGLVFYGELFGHTYSGARIQDLTYSSSTPRLAVFDVRDLANGRWLGGWERLDLCEDLNLPHVPALRAFMEYDERLVRVLAEGKSVIDGATVREGVVVESLGGNRRKAKYVSEGYLTRKGAS